jgi:predicted nucleic acid-binding protein
MMTERVFLDTSVIIAAVIGTSAEAFRLVFTSSCESHSNEYALKEVYHVLRKGFGFKEEFIAQVLDSIREKIIVHKDPPVKAFKKLKLRDKADRPIVYSAMNFNCTLIIADEVTYQDAKRYVKVRRLGD